MRAARWKIDGLRRDGYLDQRASDGWIPLWLPATAEHCQRQHQGHAHASPPRFQSGDPVQECNAGYCRLKIFCCVEIIPPLSKSMRRDFLLAGSLKSLT